MCLIQVNEDIKNNAIAAVRELIDICDLEAVLCGDADVEDWASCWCDYLRDTYNLQVFFGATKIVFSDYKSTSLDGWVIKLNLSDKVNYCEKESYLTSLAEQSGLSRFFSPCYNIGAAYGFDVYIQKQVRTFSERGERLSNAFLTIDNACGSEYRDYHIIPYMYSGDPQVYDLEYFIQKHNINDLHRGNWGVDDNGNIVLIDYCGYDVSDTLH